MNLNRQLEKLRQLITRLKGNSSFYQEKLKGLEATGISELSHLQNMPFTARAELVSRNPEFLCQPLSRISDISRTTGSKGESIYIAMSYRDLMMAARICSELAENCDLGENPSFALLLPLDELNTPAICLERAFRDISKKPVFRIGELEPEKTLAYLRDLRPTVAISTPDRLLFLGKKLDKEKTTLKKAFLLGQPIYGENYQPLEIKKQIEKLWGIETYSAYGSTEMFSGFFECREHNGHHIPELEVLAEIIDPKSKKVLPPGETGELVITTLYREAMPLLRYRTSDLSWIETDPCPCGSKLPRLMAILGRRDE